MIGAESGTRFLDCDGRILSAAKTYLKRYPKASFEEVFHWCFEGGTDYRSGKAISSRHFEPIGTKTCQILIEGRYNDILKPGVHYISVKADLSDVSGKRCASSRTSRFDEPWSRQLTPYVRAEHTYAHRVTQLLRNIRAAAELPSEWLDSFHAPPQGACTRIQLQHNGYDTGCDTSSVCATAVHKVWCPDGGLRTGGAEV